jgi:hypothetical protein
MRYWIYYCNEKWTVVVDYKFDQPEIHSIMDLYRSYMMGHQHLTDNQKITPREV